jgi:hypothetical protein
MIKAILNSIPKELCHAIFGYKMPVGSILETVKKKR